MGGSESKQILKNHVSTLLTENVDEADEKFWSSFLGAETGTEDLFELISTEQIRTLRDEKPNNAAVLCRQIIRNLQNIIEEGTRTRISTVSTNIGFSCCRLIRRLMSIFLERDSSFVDTVIWAPSYCNGDEETQDDESNEKGIIIGAEILTCLLRLLHLNNFCVVNDVYTTNLDVLPKHKVDPKFLWKTGAIGSAKVTHVNTNGYVLRTRIEVLRCLLVCLSGSLYQTIDEYQQCLPPALKVVSSGNLHFTANLFCSLMSTVFTYDPVGFGVPYGSVFSSKDQEELVNLCLQILIILMDFNPAIFSPSSMENQSSMIETSVDPRNVDSSSRMEGEKKEQPEPTARNVFRTMLAGIKKDAEIDLIYKGLINLLQTWPSAQSTYLPYSASPISFNQELLILTWHITTCNSIFLRRLTCSLDSNKLVSPLLYLLLTSSNSRRESIVGSSKVGLLHMCSFILLVLSSEREFVVKLNEPYLETFPIDIPLFRGCYADLLALVIHRVVVDSAGSASNDSLIDMLLTVLCNVSAYVKAFCLESCVKLIHLLEKFSKPSWLFKAPFHYHDVFFLLDMFNNIIQYQYEGNQKLVYSILRQKKLFLDIQNLEFSETPSKSNNIEANSEESTEITKAGTDDSLEHQKSSTDSDESEDEQNEEWVPTAAWFSDWKAKLPLQTITRLIHCLLPMVETECAEKNLVDQSEVLEFLQKTTMVGLLPVPHPIIIRNYQPNAYTSLWFTSYMWGVVFSRSQSLSFFDWKKVKLIVINNRA